MGQHLCVGSTIGGLPISLCIMCSKIGCKRTGRSLVSSRPDRYRRQRGDSSGSSTGLTGSRGTSTGGELRGGSGWRSSSRERTGLIGSRGTSTGAGLRGGSDGGSRPGCGDAGVGLRGGTFGPRGDSHFDLNIVD
jgi:hypothetical protein